ncbi:hypothetical protein FJTKL_12965 [Diaporthe vaccinii]|uniref:Uncharacterized protein n=1 Tax=Diaporthe vaccinii TaxID=105482 RepID=A0ABR4EC36_9PEZI
MTPVRSRRPHIGVEEKRSNGPAVHEDFSSQPCRSVPAASPLVSNPPAAERRPDAAGVDQLSGRAHEAVDGGVGAVEPRRDALGEGVDAGGVAAGAADLGDDDGQTVLAVLVGDVLLSVGDLGVGGCVLAGVEVEAKEVWLLVGGELGVELLEPGGAGVVAGNGGADQLDTVLGAQGEDAVLPGGGSIGGTDTVQVRLVVEVHNGVGAARLDGREEVLPLIACQLGRGADHGLEGDIGGELLWLPCVPVEGGADAGGGAEGGGRGLDVAVGCVCLGQGVVPEHDALARGGLEEDSQDLEALHGGELHDCGGLLGEMIVLSLREKDWTGLESVCSTKPLRSDGYGGSE